METAAVHTKKRGRFGPYAAAAPFAAVLFGFYGTFLPFGLAGILGFALVGVLWALLLGAVAGRLLRREDWRVWLANAPVFASILVLGFMAGGGAMYIFMMSEAVQEPTTTYAVLSALMRPAVPFFIVFNTLLELLVMLAVVFFNWDAGSRRRKLSLVGVGLYLVLRVWTYLVYAETRLEITTHTLSASDVEWFARTLAADFRPILVVLAQAAFVLAAMTPVRSPIDRNGLAAPGGEQA